MRAHRHRLMEPVDNLAPALGRRADRILDHRIVGEQGDHRLRIPPVDAVDICLQRRLHRALAGPIRHASSSARGSGG